MSSIPRHRYKIRTRIYVAGPISIGNIKGNVERAIRMGEALMRNGYAAIVPHYDVLWNPNALVGTAEYEEYLERDFSLIAACHAVLRLAGESAGADREVAWATLIGVRVYYTLEHLLEHLPPTQAFEVMESA